MAHVKVEIEIDEREIIGIVDRFRPNEKVCLSRDSLNVVRKDLLNFVHRVVSTQNRTQGEIEILPAVAELLLRHFGC